MTERTRNRTLLAAALWTGLAASSGAQEAAQPNAHEWLDSPDHGTAATCGGPGGNFDVQVPDGQVLVFDTTSTIFVGGPNFVPTTQVVVTDGILHVRNLRIGAGALLKCVGPNPVQIFATGNVEILGEVNVDGSSSFGVTTLNTTDVPEIGAPGQCGGGQGGTASFLTTQSTPQGGQGFGAFNAPGGGGFGGETGWSNSTNVQLRRGAGGGGGTFGRDQTLFGSIDESLIGQNVEAGFDGGANAFGALDPQAMSGPPKGGAAGPSVFQDGKIRNDFHGRRFDPVTGQVTEGELDAPSAGAGGGAGGDSSFVPSGVFPSTPFQPTGDEKGGSGGGGGGSVFVVAKGTIRFGQDGLVSARGGHGGGGESTNFVNRVGAAGGGGSGGHVILQAGMGLDLSASDRLAPAILATGGQGGAGANDLHGAGVNGETAASDDACPDPDNGCFGPHTGTGGDGGPGVIQLHVRGGSQNILLPNGTPIGFLVEPYPWLDMIPFDFPPCVMPSTASETNEPEPKESWLQRVRVPGLTTR